MRDPWFPVALTLTVLLGAALATFGPLVQKIEIGTFKLQDWQTLTGALVAVVAAGIAWFNVSRQIRTTERLETVRRARKHAALRAVLPLTLSAINEYAAECAEGLKKLHGQCTNFSWVPPGALVPEFPIVPSETIKNLSEFIEYSEPSQTILFENLLMRIQVQSARIRAMVDQLQLGSSRTMITGVHNIETYIVNTATIYAGASVAYNFGRRLSDELPRDVIWDDVRNSLRTLDVDEVKFPKLWKNIDRREADGAGPQ